MLHQCFLDNKDTWMGEERSLAVRRNDFPVSGFHLLLFPKEHREQLKPTDVGETLVFAQRHPEYFIFHNMRGSGATRPDHLHFQAVLRGEPLPIEIVPREEFQVSEDGTSIHRLQGYPIYAVAIRGPHAVEMVFAVIEELQPTPYY